MGAWFLVVVLFVSASSQVSTTQRFESEIVCKKAGNVFIEEVKKSQPYARVFVNSCTNLYTVD